MSDAAPQDLIATSADIVRSYVANNRIGAAELPELITSVHRTLAGLGAAPAEAAPEKPARTMSVRASIKPDRLISMIDGKPYQVLRRHLRTHGLTPEQYRERFDLPRDYPMVASAFSEMRRGVAKAHGLGRKAAAAVADTAQALEDKVEEAIKPKRKASGKPATTAPKRARVRDTAA